MVQLLGAGQRKLKNQARETPRQFIERESHYLWCGEYVVVHEMVHLLESTHSDRFIAILEEHYPTWREARAELNELPLTAEAWKE